MINSAEEFIRLRESEDATLYKRAVEESASEEVWLNVIRLYPEMKIWVVRNKTIPSTVLQILADDRDPGIREAVARKRKVDKSILERLAEDSDESVRLAVAFNTKTPLLILHKLSTDNWDRVAEVARVRLLELGSK